MPYNGQPQPIDTTSLDLPPALASLLGINPAAPVDATTAGIGGSMSPQQQAPVQAGVQPMPSYAIGGTIGQGGMPATRPITPDQMPGGMPPDMPMMGQPQMGGGGGGMMPPGPGLAAPGANTSMTPDQIQSAAQQFVQSHPQQVQHIKMAVQQAIQSGSMTQQQLNTMVQMAIAALQNPEMYPQLRRLAIQQGLASEQDLSQQIDKGLLFTLIVVGQAMQSGGGQAEPLPAFKNGGQVPSGKTKTSSDNEPVVIKAHEGEYVIPKHVVLAKGTDFFDKLVQQYSEAADGAKG